jgi:GNAT superfamily N-acetyltransferase
MAIGFRQASDNDYEALLALRLVTMRPSLERLGRFNLARATERFRSSFNCNWARIIVDGEEVLGCVSLRPSGERETWLEHFYIAPAHQGRGAGAKVLAMLFGEADANNKTLNIEVLKESAANQFYVRHGFVETHRGEWDIYYRRDPAHHAPLQSAPSGVEGT